MRDLPMKKVNVMVNKNEFEKNGVTVKLEDGYEVFIAPCDLGLEGIKYNCYKDDIKYEISIKSNIQVLITALEPKILIDGKEVEV